MEAPIRVRVGTLSLDLTPQEASKITEDLNRLWAEAIPKLKVIKGGKK